MKKLIAKLALFTIFSIMLSSVALAAPPATPANSQEAVDLKNKLKGAKDYPCINSTEKDANGNKKEGTGTDDGFIVTIIEEPLGTQDDENDPNFKSRTCYRHTLQWTLPGSNKLETASEFSRYSKATDTGQPCYTNLPDYEDVENYNAKYSCSIVQVLLSKGGTHLLYGYIGMIYQWGASMVGIIAVLIIVLSGIQISAAGGDQEAVTSAKKRILQSLAGIAVLFLSGLILYTINPTFFVR
ncbi:MAG: pilin [bacterium]|nr:pilin [bacterium]